MSTVLLLIEKTLVLRHEESRRRGGAGRGGRSPRTLVRGVPGKSEKDGRQMHDTGGILLWLLTGSPHQSHQRPPSFPNPGRTGGPGINPRMDGWVVVSSGWLRSWFSGNQNPGASERAVSGGVASPTHQSTSNPHAPRPRFLGNPASQSQRPPLWAARCCGKPRPVSVLLTRSGRGPLVSFGLPPLFFPTTTFRVLVSWTRDGDPFHC
jgi:hypothetical protein